MDTIKIRPSDEIQAAGGYVLDPTTGAKLAGDGEDKPRTEYWLRRLRDGDVVEVGGTAKKKRSGASE